MNSFRTSKDTMKVLQTNKKFHQEDIPMEIIPASGAEESSAETGMPVSFPANPELEWCPPGHGDLFSAMFGNPVCLTRLRRRGFKYLFISNSDNLGARPLPYACAAFREYGRTVHDRGRQTHPSRS